MINLILFGTFFIMLLLNIPIAVSLGTSAILAMVYAHDPFTVISTNVYNGMAKFLLLAIPFFVLSGNIMAKAGISTRLVNFIDDCVGHRRGGIAIVCVIVACFFGAISGSGPATVAALGIILIPAMINRGGFSAPFASAMMATASSIAIVIPPSIAFVVYASITGVSVGDMFLGGVVPGLLTIIALIALNSFFAVDFGFGEALRCRFQSGCNQLSDFKQQFITVTTPTAFRAERIIPSRSLNRLAVIYSFCSVCGAF